jgi:hypothetical protein
MRFALDIYVSDLVKTVSVEVADIHNDALWPVQTQNPLKDYAINLPHVSATYQNQDIKVQLEFDVRSYKLQLAFHTGEWHTVLESHDAQQLRRHFLRTLLLKWREEEATQIMSHDAKIIYELAQTEVRRLEGR